MKNKTTPNADHRECLREVIDRIENTGNTTPLYRAAFKAGYSFSGEPLEVQLPFWDFAWRAAISDRVRVQAFFYLESVIGKKQYAELIWHTVSAWQDSVTHWGLCDALAKIYTKLLESSCRRDVYERLKV